MIAPRHIGVAVVLAATLGCAKKGGDPAPIDDAPQTIPVAKADPAPKVSDPKPPEAGGSKLPVVPKSLTPKTTAPVEAPPKPALPVAVAPPPREKKTPALVKTEPKREGGTKKLEVPQKGEIYLKDLISPDGKVQIFSSTLKQNIFSIRDPDMKAWTIALRNANGKEVVVKQHEIIYLDDRKIVYANKGDPHFGFRCGLRNSDLAIVLSPVTPDLVDMNFIVDPANKRLTLHALEMPRLVPPPDVEWIKPVFPAATTNASKLITVDGVQIKSFTDIPFQQLTSGKEAQYTTLDLHAQCVGRVVLEDGWRFSDVGSKDAGWQRLDPASSVFLDKKKLSSAGEAAGNYGVEFRTSDDGKTAWIMWVNPDLNRTGNVRISTYGSQKLARLELTAISDYTPPKKQ